MFAFKLMSLYELPYPFCYGFKVPSFAFYKDDFGIK